MKQMGLRPSMNEMKAEQIGHTIRRVRIVFLGLRLEELWEGGKHYGNSTVGT